MIESPLCSICKENVETIEHLFQTCEPVYELWRRVLSDILSAYEINSIGLESILLGFYKENEEQGGQIIVNHIVLIVKYYIFMCKLKEITRIWSGMLRQLKYTEFLERKIQ